jgi:hypothetical protein
MDLLQHKHHISSRKCGNTGNLDEGTQDSICHRLKQTYNVAHQTSLGSNVHIHRRPDGQQEFRINFSVLQATLEWGTRSRRGYWHRSMGSHCDHASAPCRVLARQVKAYRRNLSSASKIMLPASSSSSSSSSKYASSMDPCPGLYSASSRAFSSRGLSSSSPRLAGME